jgi:regulator of nucleoside diphosphate kinase
MTIAPDREYEIVTSRERPRVFVSADDHARLTSLAKAAMDRMPNLASRLAEELERAEVLVDGRDLDDVVRVGTKVEYRDDISGNVRTVELVYPEAADIGAGRLSVLTPVGTALLGLRIGDSIDWETPAGESRSLTIVAVCESPPNKQPNV